MLLNNNHASGPEAIASDVNNPSDLINEADVDDVEHDAEQSYNKTHDTSSKWLNVVERGDDVAWVTKVQQRHSTSVFEWCWRVDDRIQRSSRLVFATERTLSLHVTQRVHVFGVTYRRLYHYTANQSNTLTNPYFVSHQRPLVSDHCSRSVSVFGMIAWLLYLI